jgi:hypothetical protein
MLVNTTPEDFLRSVDDARAERRRQKELERSLDTRVLEPWERYRALTDHYEALQDLSEQSDRKTRFALIILGSINAVNLLIVARGDLVGLSHGGGPLVNGYVAFYAVLSLCLFCYAIAALRPRTPQLTGDTAPGASPRPSLRFPQGLLQQTLEQYHQTWQQAQIAQLNSELEAIVYLTARDNATKTRALHRVYVGLYVLVALTAALLVVLGAASVRGSA